MSALELVSGPIAAARAAKAAAKTAEAAKAAKPFYSAVDKAALELSRGKGTGKEFMTELIKVKGVKPTEIKERGLDKIEAMPKMTKEQFLDELEKRPAPQVEEKVVRQPSPLEIEERASEMAYDEARVQARANGYYGEQLDDVATEIQEDILRDRDSFNEYLERAREDLDVSGVAPQHEDWTLPGGENYREILLKMPSFKKEQELAQLQSYLRRVPESANPYRHKELKDKIAVLEAEKAKLPEQFAGVRGHFANEPGILASIRVKDRIGPNGEKVLHVEEIQSDWHQQGRKKGYGPKIEKTVEAYYETKDGQRIPVGFGKTKEEAEASIDIGWKNLVDIKYETLERKVGEGVPDAPFKKNWHELAMKRVLNYAAEHGYDKVAITPGAEQAERYKLSNVIDEINVTGRTHALTGEVTKSVALDTKDGKSLRFGVSADGTIDNVNDPTLSNFMGKSLDEVVGKDMSKKIMEGGTQTISGEGLAVGGEGMKGFYDKILPDYLNTYGKKYGAKVEPFNITVPPKDSMATSGRVGADDYIAGRITWPEFLQQNPEAASEFVESVHSFPITPEMRQDITGKGLPLYQQIGIPAGGAAAGAEALQPEEQGYADGGVVMAAKGGEFDTEPDMADGGARIQGTAFKKGGRVHVTDNPDIMLLDLLSRN